VETGFSKTVVIVTRVTLPSGTSDVTVTYSFICLYHMYGFIRSPYCIWLIDVFLVNLCGKTSLHIWRSGSSWIEKNCMKFAAIRKWSMIYYSV